MTVPSTLLEHTAPQPRPVAPRAQAASYWSQSAVSAAWKRAVRLSSAPHPAPRSRRVSNPQVVALLASHPACAPLSRNAYGQSALHVRRSQPAQPAPSCAAWRA